MALIKFRGVSRRYGESWAVHALDLDIEEGKLVALIGPSGSGKTTTLRMINRLVVPDGGHIDYDGHAIESYRPEELRRMMGYVIQSVGLFPHRTVLENVCTVPALLKTPKARAERRADELLALVGLDPAIYRGRFPRQLSGGEAQRVGVARALAADPPVLLMDEPFGAVDPLQRSRLQDEFLRIQREIRKTVVLVTHDLDEAVRLADTVVLMRNGSIEQIDTPARLLAEPASDFARDFVGDERSLKRLARVSAGSIARPALTVPLGECAPVADGSCDGPALYWVVDRDGVLVGRALPGHPARRWLEPSPVLTTESSLKECLTAMLGEGSMVVALVDGHGQLAGQISLSDIASSSGKAELGGGS